MSEKEKLALLEETLELDEGTLRPDTVLRDLDAYTSMAMLSLIVMFDDEFDRRITGAEVKAFTTAGDILALME